MNKKLFKSPIFQITSLFTLAFVVMLIATQLANQPDVNYLISSFAMLLFIMFNSLIGFKVNRWKKYILQSAVSFAIGTPLLIFISHLISKQPIYDFPEFKSIFPALIISYYIILALTTLLRNIASFMNMD
jgi:uncharacterized membrane protein